MTSTTDTAGHPDVAELSDLTEGLLPPSRTADVRQHLDGCVLCADVYDSLEEIRGLLGTLPGPTRMPDDVAGRIDAALAAEALLSAMSPDHASGAEDEGASVSRETSAVDVSVAAADSGSASSADRPSGHPRASTGPGRAHRGRRGRRRAAVLGTVFTAAALGLGAILVQSMGGDSKGPETTTQQESGSQVTFSEGQLKNQVADLLAKNKNKDSRSGSAKPWGIESNGTETESGGGGVDTLITPTVHVPDCVQQGTGNSGVVLAAEKGTYKGTSVYLVVQPDASDGTKVTASIVDAACVKQDSPSPGKRLLTQSYARS
ncbi:anti-sigma factor family protein [Streptomyces sp. NPDC001530]|uniref:anti-sigma factor family protein n=1 Tax=Streptomyces sp. NPDC001530 TaxID=3364582 RepID=UPI0036AB9D3A